MPLRLSWCPGSLISCAQWATESWNDGQLDLAVSVYRRVLELDPDHPVAQERLRQLQNRSRPDVR